MRSTIVSLATAALLTLSACGGDTAPTDPSAATDSPAASSADESAASPERTSPTPSTEEEPAADAGGVAEAKSTLVTWVDAVAAGDAGTACALQTPRYTDAGIEELVGDGWMEAPGSCEEVVSMVSLMIQEFGAQMQVTSTEVVSATDDEVVLRVRYTDSDPEVYKLVAVDGRWLVDDEGAKLAR